MAFDPTRLTGKRRRKWLRSMNWAPTASDVPKTLLKYVRYPNRLKLWARVKTKDDTYHYVAVVRSRVVLFHHGTAAEEALLHELANRPLRCVCHAVREMVATLHLVRHHDKHDHRLSRPDPLPNYPTRRTMLGRAHRREDLPVGWVTVLDGRRKPIEAWRKMDPPDRARRRGSDRWSTETVPDAQHHRPATPPKTILERWTRDVVPTALRKVELQLSQALALHPDDEVVLKHNVRRADHDDSVYSAGQRTSTEFTLSTAYDSTLDRRRVYLRLELDALSWVAGVYGYDLALAVPGHFVTAAWGGSRADPDAPFLVEAVKTGRIRTNLADLDPDDREAHFTTKDNEAVVYGLFHRPSRAFRILGHDPVIVSRWPVGKEHPHLTKTLPGHPQ